MKYKIMNNKKLNTTFCLIILTILLTVATINAQESNIGKVKLTKIAQVNDGNSYITFLGGIGNIEPLWFEGNIIPQFHLRTSKNSKLMGVLTPQIIIRMYQAESFPVGTPSYMPKITLYWLFSEKGVSDNWSLFGRLAHHSNGQAGNFYLNNGEINYKSGNFSTNYLEFGLIKTHYIADKNLAQFFRTSFEAHLPKLSDPDLRGLYSFYRWHFMFSLFKLPAEVLFNKNNIKANFSLEGKLTWMFGEVKNWGNFSLERVSVSIRFFYHPKFLEDVGLFLQYYHGPDYYNIYFTHRLNILRFGIMTETLRF